MCGIVGIFDTRGRREIDRAVLQRMNNSQAHRGPDGDGLHIDAGVGLGHRRLAIIDVATGQQPLYNEDESIVVVFNGEIYNYQALIPELQSLGHVFHTKSDTEVIVHAWESWGERCVDRFRGMFAFAIFDRANETLFLARDRLGVKPLFYSLLPNGLFVFGSELKAVLAHGGIDRAIDAFAVEEYFGLGYVPDPRSIFKSVAKLPAAHSMKLVRGVASVVPRRYWDVQFKLDSPVSEEDACDELRSRLIEVVKLRMISEVPLGAFLSGGVDSSAVVAAMAGLSSEPVNTCSISFDDPAFDETAFAKMVADRYQTRHFVGHVASDDFDLIDELARVYDEPYADSSAIPTYRVCQLARTRVTVALSGDGGDESFGGYRRYRMHLMEERLRSRVPLGLRKAVFGSLGRLYPKADWAPRFVRGKTTLQSLARSSVEAYAESIACVHEPLRRQMLSREFSAQLGGYRALEVLQGYAEQAGTDDTLALIQYIDLNTYLVGDINTKVDRASMAHSLEVREPLMDYKLVEWMATLPSRLKIQGGEGKYLFKKAMEPLLPNDVLYRPKMGFAVPLARWLRGPLKERVRESVLGPRLLDTGMFRREVLEGLVRTHESGVRDHATPLWTLLMFDAFLRRMDSA
jgi:asparagine synthase (glutamine-hydrolysing)